MKFRGAFLGLLAIVATPLQAKWYEAQSEHFVIYADDSEKDVRRFAENLEKYHSAMELLTGRTVERPSPSNRVTIFVVGSQRDIRELSGSDSDTIAGFYVPRAGASRAFVQDLHHKSGYPSFSTVVLLHEYAHHFLISSSPYAMPRWLSEGAAEFFAATSFNNDGTIHIGRPAQHRAGELRYAEEVSVAELLDPDLYAKRDSRRYDAFYGMSWALYHYLIFNEDRQGQLAQYWQGIMQGLTSIESARAAFGDIDALDKELGRYLKQRRMFGYKLQPDMISHGPVTLREVPAGEAEMLEVRMVSQRGVTREEALELVEKARDIASRHPEDPGVLTALAEAEYDAGFDDAAIAAADAAMALDPSRANAHVQKGFALFRKAEDADDLDAAYQKAILAFSALNKIERDHPLPLIYYYRSFIERGVEPNETARHALERASQLSPFDQGLAMNAALMLAKEGKIELAKVGMKPIAANPHGGALSEQARSFLELLEKAEDGKPWHPRAAIIEAVSEGSSDNDAGETAG